MSSVCETLLPMRGLSAYAEPSGDRQAHRAGQRAAEVFLDRRVLFRRTSGRPVRADWAKLHDPVYWPYDMLAALKGPAEAGRIDDPWCADALDLLERKQLPTGGGRPMRHTPGVSARDRAWNWSCRWGRVPGRAVVGRTGTGADERMGHRGRAVRPAQSRTALETYRPG